MAKAKQKLDHSEAELPFETIIERLEVIAKKLEGGDTKLEESLALYEEGVGLAKAGTARLDEAERKLEILRDGDDVESFEPDGGAAGT